MTIVTDASTSPFLPTTMDDNLDELAQRLRTATIAHGAPAGETITGRSNSVVDRRPLTWYFSVFRMFGDYVHGIGDFLEATPDVRQA